MKITKIFPGIGGNSRAWSYNSPAIVVFDDGTKIENGFPLCFLREGMEFQDLDEFWGQVYSAQSEIITWPITTTVDGVVVHAREKGGGCLRIDDGGKRVFVRPKDISPEMKAKHWAKIFARADTEAGFTVPQELL